MTSRWARNGGMGSRVCDVGLGFSGVSHSTWGYGWYAALGFFATGYVAFMVFLWYVAEACGVLGVAGPLFCWTLKKSLAGDFFLQKTLFSPFS